MGPHAGIAAGRDYAAPAYTPAASVSRRTGWLDALAWRDALMVWLGTRLLVGLFALGGRWLYLGRPPTWIELLVPWSGWDGAIYGTIATSGYPLPQYAPFFPLFPLLERAAAFVTGWNPAAAGVLVANLVCLPALGLLRVLIEREAGRELARRTLLLLAIFPTALYLAAAYTESLFLLLSVAAFLALRERRYLMAGVLAALATLTRPVGILLLVPLAWQCAAQVRERGLPDVRGMLRMAAALGLPIAALGGFWLYLAARFGSLTVMLQAQAGTWGKHLTWPWVGLAQAFAALGPATTLIRMHILLDIGFTLLFAALALFAMGRLPPPYGLYALANASLVILTPAQRAGYTWAALASNGRYLLVVFPCLWVLALWCRRRAVRIPLVVLSLALFALLTAMFANGAWVA
jgi:Mannosyltransferase (PIG-V)